MWDDIIGEPEGLRTINCAWNCSYKCFKGTKNCCYILLTVLFAPCFAFCSALNFACLAFQVIKFYRILEHFDSKLNYGCYFNSLFIIIAYLVYGSMSQDLEDQLCFRPCLLYCRVSWMLWSLCRIMRPLFCKNQSTVSTFTRRRRGQRYNDSLAQFKRILV